MSGRRRVTSALHGAYERGAKQHEQLRSTWSWVVQQFAPLCILAQPNAGVRKKWIAIHRNDRENCGKGAARLPTYPTLEHLPMPSAQKKPRPPGRGCTT